MADEVPIELDTQQVSQTLMISLIEDLRTGRQLGLRIELNVPLSVHPLPKVQKFGRKYETDLMEWTEEELLSI